MDKLNPTVSPNEAILQKKLGEVQHSTKNPRKLKEATEDFEAIFVYFLLRTMRQTVMKSGLLETGLQGEVMEALFDEELSREVARHTRLGIAEMLQEQLGGRIQNEEGDPPKAPTAPPRKSFLPKVRAIGRYLQQVVENRLAPFEKYIHEAARLHQLDADLVRAVILAESSGDPQAVSAKGAKGLMQLMDETAREMGVTDVFDPRENILAGSGYLRHLLNRFNGDVRLALAAYNAGPTAVKKFGDIPPYSETQNYVSRILAYYHQLKK